MKHQLLPPKQKSTRGQTIIDYIVGISLILTVVSFTLFTIPEIVDPYETPGESNAVISDRGADHVTQHILQESGSSPYVLDAECTDAFFNGTPTTACDVDSDELHEIMGHREDTNIYITLANETGITEEIGDDIDRPSENQVFISTRIVVISGETKEMKYYVW